MYFERFIASRILKGEGIGIRFTNPLLRIAIAAIALGMAVMIVSILVVTGFRKQITDKVIGFGSHIQISSFDNNYSYEETPISASPSFLNDLTKDPDIKGIHPFASKAGIIKAEEDIEGIILKGVDQNYDWSFFDNKIISGNLPDFSDSTQKLNILISAGMASRLRLDTGKAAIVYFIEQPPRIRKFIICGIYETGLEEFDKLYAYCDINVIRKLNSWNDTLVGGFEVSLTNPDHLEKVTDKVYMAAGYEYNTLSIRELYPQIFHWLDLQDINVYIILGLIILVSGISMISILMIIILDNTTTIGVLKALGSTNRSVRMIFIRVALPIVLYGMIIGNILGLGIGFLQAQFGLIKLPVESYYVSEVPVQFPPAALLVLNLATLVCCAAILIGPSAVISRIRPSRVIKFD